MTAKTSRSIRRIRIRNLLCSIPFFLLVLLVLVRLGHWALDGVKKASDDLLIDVFDVGQSDAALVRCDGLSMLIDCGTAAAGSSLVCSLQELHVKRLDYVIITHPHEDHYGNLRLILSNFTVGKVLTPRVLVDDPVFSGLLDELAIREIPLEYAETGHVFALGRASARVLAAGGEDPNNGSLVLRISYVDTMLLFMGDAESAVEKMLLKAYSVDLLNCDFLKVGHHGSETASTPAFINAVTPAVATISCGVDNEFGFPREAVLQALASVGASVYRTDLDGDLHFSCDGHTFKEREDRAW